jgi:MFS family permease
MPARRLIVLVCLMGATTTVSIGAFPALLPELGSAAGLADWQLGAVAGIFGLARMLANLPVGLFITHHLARALMLAPLLTLLGALSLAAGHGFGGLLLGRSLMGVGHTLTMLGGLTAILRHHSGAGLASSLAAVEFSAMLGVLSGATLLTLLPHSVPWNAAILLACAPLLVNLALLPALRRALPRPELGGPRPLFARSQDGPAGTAASPAAEVPRSAARLAALAVAAGAAVAVSYSTVEQFAIPLRGSREFGLQRAGIARLSMLSQGVDILTLLPLGALADRRGTPVVLGGVLLVFAVALGFIGFGALPLLAFGCGLFGFSMAAWMLPLSILRAVTPPAQVAWRTARYRVCVDGGMFAGPFVAGLLGTGQAGVLPGLLMVVMAALGLALLWHSRRPPVAPR